MKGAGEDEESKKRENGKQPEASQSVSHQGPRVHRPIARSCRFVVACAPASHSHAARRPLIQQLTPHSSPGAARHKAHTAPHPHLAPLLVLPFLPITPDTTMTSATPQSKAVLYSFPGSVWASVPRLCLVEKGYEAHDVEIKTVNLLLGENFSPAYLRINPKATLPTLVVPLAETMSSEMDTKFRAITSTREVLKFLDQSRSAHILDQRGENATANPAPVLAPATVEGNAIAEKFLEMVHGMEADPNFLLLAAKSPEDVKKQAGAMQGTFVKNR